MTRAGKGRKKSELRLVSCKSEIKSEIKSGIKSMYSSQQPLHKTEIRMKEFQMKELQMDELQEMIQMKMAEYDRMIRMAEDAVRKAPKGVLRVTHNRGTFQYYRREEPNSNEKYIRKSERRLLSGLAQKDYLQKMLPVLRSAYESMKDMMRVYEPEKLTQIYEEMTEGKRELISPLVMSDADYAAEWLRQNSMEEIRIEEPDTEIYTEKGEMVRSKSEKILADKFNLLGIPYIYEKPLYLEGYGYVHPDFTLLNVRKKKEYYLEHFGMMDNPEYTVKTVQKLETYEKNGIFPGEKLLLTYETGSHPLNMKTVENLIQKFLL